VPLALDLLGPLRVWDGDNGRIDGLRPAQRRLLAILALEGGGRADTSRLIDRFWAGEPPATAKAALQTHVSALRRRVPEGLVVTESDGYSLDLTDVRVDAVALCDAVHEVEQLAAAGRFDAAAEVAEHALSTWRGCPFAELEDDDFARSEITRLEQIRLALVEEHAGALLESGRAAEALAALEGLVLAHPLRERLWEHLIVGRHRLGRHVDAVRAFREIEQRFAEAGLEPSERLRSLEHRVLVHDTVLTAPPRQHRLPTPRTRFIGRVDEQALIADLLRSHRLVTLTGAGGCGKTRLAIALAGAFDELAPDGVAFVDLAPLSDPALIPRAVAAAMGVPPGGGLDGGTVQGQMATVVKALASRRLLVILDNCEHLSDGCAAVTDQLLFECPDLRVLATSRESLGVEGEQVHRVRPLSLPDAARPAADAEAVQLFLDRAAALSSRFDPDQHHLATIAEICRRLDGMPLAIEFAAARTEHLTLGTIADRLDDRFRLLTSGRRRVPRHQTLAATLDWSHELLTEQERVVLRRLAVFAGSIPLSMAEAVCAGDGVPAPDVVDLVGSLVARSLVSLDDGNHGEPRYRLLETVRSYAALHLRDCGELDTFRSRHRDAYLSWLESVAWGHGYSDPGWVAGVIREHDNLRAALAWSRAQGRRDLVGRLAAGAHILWQPGVGHGDEGRGWASWALEEPDGLDDHQLGTCWLAKAEAEMAMLSPGVETAARRAAELLGPGLSSPLVQARCLEAVGIACRAAATGDQDVARHARAAAEELVRVGEHVGGPWLTQALLFHGQTMVVLDDLDAAHASLTAAGERRQPTFHYRDGLGAELATCRSIRGDAERALDAVGGELAVGAPGIRRRPWVHAAAALAQTQLGDYDEAAANLAEALRLSEVAPVFLEANECLVYAGAIAHEIGEPHVCGTLLSAALMTGDASVPAFPFRSPASYALHRHLLRLLRHELASDQRRSYQQQGAGMEAHEAVSLALDIVSELRSRRRSVNV